MDHQDTGRMIVQIGACGLVRSRLPGTACFGAAKLQERRALPLSALARRVSAILRLILHEIEKGGRWMSPEILGVGCFGVVSKCTDRRCW
jgi:hypothetical protein